MKNPLFFALTAAAHWLSYFFAWVNLRCLERSLHDKCNLLPEIIDVQTRADMQLSIRQLSADVVDARNHLRSMRPEPLRRRTWREA